MKPETNREVSPARRGSRIALVLAALALAGGAWFAFGSAQDRTGPETRADAADPRSSSLAAAAVPSADVAVAPDPPELPEGALPPILGEPRLDRIDYCDARNWTRVDALVREVRGDELIVDESAWQRAGASTRAGLASWASKCRLDGRSLVVRAYGSGRELGAYGAAAGYESLD